jgi:drug/metabolite transporter (DMT)-like permease
MAWLLVLNSIFFVATLTEYLICMKYITNNYDYKNEWFNVLLSLVFTPFYGCLFIRNFSWQRAKAYFAPERRHVLKYPVFTGVLYTVETVFVFYALNTVTLSYYTILRSGFIIFNIPWFKYLLKKPVTRLYYASCAALVISHAFATGQYILQYNNDGGGGGGGGTVLRNTVIIFASCFLNSAYNNIIEYAMKRHGDTMSNIDFQILFQATYFVLAVPWAVFYTAKHTPPVTAGAITMYFFIAFGLQLYMFNKIYILNSRESIIPANILLSGLDLVRRVIQLTYSFVWFNEPFDAVIGASLVFLGLSGGLLLYQYIQDYRRSSGVHHHRRMIELPELDQGYEAGDEKNTKEEPV